tara:strand:- start:130 stop:468 length:339 start_codon:yes stop_codon:yes gene_type:complete
MLANFHRITHLVQKDVEKLKEAEKTYGASWHKRGGIGAFMMLARKWDRIENQTAEFNYDVFKTIANDRSDSGILDDIRDLRRYLLLVEDYCAKKELKEPSDENLHSNKGKTV